MINTRKSVLILGFIFMVSSPVLIAVLPQTQHIDLALPCVDSKKKNARMRKSTGPKVKKIYTYRDMEYDQLLVAKDKLLEQKNRTSAIKYLEQLIKLSDPEDTLIIEKHRLEIADLIFEEEDYPKAAQKYAEFSLLHPGGERIEYALYRAIISSFNCCLAYERDQTKTEETLALAESFLKQDHFIAYVEQVQDIVQQCYTRLIESELSVCQFYLNRGSLRSAEKRIAFVRATWLPKDNSIEASVVALEQNLEEQKNLRIQKAEKQMRVAQNKHAKRMTERF